MRKWTKEQEDYLIQIYKGKSNDDIAELINKKFDTNYTRESVNGKKQRMGLRSEPPKNNSKYTKEVIDYVIQNHKGKSLIELTYEVNEKFNLNVDKVSIGNLKSRLRIKQGIKLEYARNDGCFKKGNLSHNKGKKWDDYLTKEQQDRARTTCFKKGHKSANAVDIGTEKIKYSKGDDIGYWNVKVCDGKGHRNWVPKHRLIYEKEYGPIPDGYKVIFADGNRENFDIDNLVLVSSSEELILNRRKLLTDDKEITKTGVLIAKVIDKTYKLKNERL